MLNQYKPPVTDRRIRFALAGCGRIARSHFEAMRQHEASAELVGVCDIDPAALGNAEKLTGARPFSRYEDMIANVDADVVVLATPSGLHPRQTIQAAEAGLNVMTEKPMATHWHDGQRMVDACDQAGVRLFVVKQNRRNATLQLLKRAVERKRFGRIYMVTVNVFWCRPQEYYDSARWRGTWEFDGGAFMNQASHYIDLLDWLIGPVESVHAYTATMLTYPRNLEGSITIIGEKGTARVGGVAVNEIQHWEFAEADEDDAKVKDASYLTTSVYGFGHPLYYDNVLRVLRGEAEPETDGREGLRSLEILIAAYLSARDGRRVCLPLEH